MTRKRGTLALVQAPEPISFVACLANDGNRNALVRKGTGECYLTLEVSLTETPDLWQRFDELVEVAFRVTITPE